MKLRLLKLKLKLTVKFFFFSLKTFDSSLQKYEFFVGKIVSLPKIFYEIFTCQK